MAERFLRTALARVGAEEMLTPRELIRDFLSFLDILREDGTATVDGLLASLAPTTHTEEPTAQPKTPAASLFFDLKL